MAIPPKLEKELEELREQFTIELVENSNLIYLVFKDFPLGEGFSVPTSDLLLQIPKTYPDTGPDMFWTNTNVTFADGKIPQAAEAVESHLERSWRRFSWHRPGWNPIIDNMHSHIEFIYRRLRVKT